MTRHISRTSLISAAALALVVSGVRIGFERG